VRGCALHDDVAGRRANVENRDSEVRVVRRFSTVPTGPAPMTRMWGLC
jgi:hypothetical protein